MIGQMRHKITFQLPTATPVVGAGRKTTYTEGMTEWAKAVKIKNAVEVQGYGTVLGKTYKFTIRQRDDFTPNLNMLLKFEGRVYVIKGIEDLNERERWWVLVGSEQE